MIFILRHGERADNAGPEEKKLIECECDPHLTPWGKIQAKAAGIQLRSLIQDSFKNGLLKTQNPQIVMVSSPFLRCLQTASGILEAFKDEEIFNESIFIDTGISEYLSTSFYDKDPMGNLFIVKKDRKCLEKYVKYQVLEGFLGEKKYSGSPIYPEEYEGFSERVEKAYAQLVEYFMTEINKNNDKVLILVSHGLAVKGMLSHHLGYHMDRGADYTCISQILYNPEIKEKGIILKKLCRAHLDDLEKSHLAHDSKESVN